MNIIYFEKAIPGDYNHKNRHVICELEDVKIEFVGLPYQPYLASYKNKNAIIGNLTGLWSANVYNSFPDGTSEIFAHNKFLDRDSAFSFAFYHLTKNESDV